MYEKKRVQKYIEKLTSKTKPRKILVCMIYYPDENASTPSWAGPALGALGYNTDPSKLQLMIRRAFVEATSYVTKQNKTKRFFLCIRFWQVPEFSF